MSVSQHRIMLELLAAATLRQAGVWLPFTGGSAWDRLPDEGGHRHLHGKPGFAAVHIRHEAHHGRADRHRKWRPRRLQS